MDSIRGALFSCGQGHFFVYTRCQLFKAAYAEALHEKYMLNRTLRFNRRFP